MNAFSPWFSLDGSMQMMPQGQGPLIDQPLAPMPTMPKQATRQVAMQSAPRAVTSQMPMQSGPPDLMQLITSGFDERKGNISQVEDRLRNLPAQGDQVNLKPLLSLADSLNQTNFASSYTVPESKDALKTKLFDQLGKEKQALADDQIKLMAALSKNEQFDDSLKYKEAFLRAYRDKNDMQAANAAARMGKEKPASATANEAAGYARRLQQSDEIFQNLVNQGYQGLSRADQAMSYLPNEVQDPKAQQFDQSTRNFINATLRRESGAAIAPSEFQNAKQQYIPQPGDSAEVLAQKAANRAQVFQNFKTEGGVAFDKIPYISPTKMLKKGKKTVVIIDPFGNPRNVPEDQVEQALKNGGKRAP